MKNDSSGADEEKDYIPGMMNSGSNRELESPYSKNFGKLGGRSSSNDSLTQHNRLTEKIL
jgi:hypothetical protein